MVRNEVTVASLSYELAGRCFRVAGHALELAPREHSVLELLITHANTPVSKQVLSNHIVALDSSLSVEAIEIYVHRLRKKLEGSGAHIRTLRGLGYMLEAAQ